MKRWIVWGATALMLTAATLGALLVATPLPPQEAPSVYRVIGEWEGRVAVFLPQASSPEQVYDTWVSSLPDEDQRRLREGVTVGDTAELAARLEDYTS